MLEQINIELLKLQDELKKLKSATELIAQSGKLSKDVIDTAQNLNEKFRDLLKKIQSMVSDYMNKTYKYTEENLTKLFYSFQQRVKEEEQLLNKFSEISTNSEDLLKQAVQSILDSDKQKIQQLINQINSALDQQKKLLDQYAKNIENNFKNITDTHKKHLDQEQQILNSYLELAESTAKLTKVISNINFPQRLDLLEQKIDTLTQRHEESHIELKNSSKKQSDQIIEKLELILSNQEDIYSKIEKLRKKLNSNKILLWLSFLIILALTSAFAYFAFKFHLIKF